MMKLCEDCSQWAQWQLRWIEPEPKEKTDEAEIPTGDGLHESTVKKKLVPRGLKYSDGPYLCATHKLAMEEQLKQESNPARNGRFFFIGARPA